MRWDLTRLGFLLLRKEVHWQPKYPKVNITSIHNPLWMLILQILDEVEKRRAISPALVQPFMRGIMEAPFPAPGRTISVKNFLPGCGTEVSRSPGVSFPGLNSNVLWKPFLLSFHIFWPAGDRTVSTLGFAPGTCGFWMSLLFTESPPPPPNICLPAAGAQGHLHCWQTQVNVGRCHLRRKRFWNLKICRWVCYIHPVQSRWSLCSFCNSFNVENITFIVP